METGKEVTKVETGLARPPDRVISEAKIAVNVFKGVIEQKPKKVVINGEQYLEYEDWQTLGEFYRCSAITRDAVPIEVDGVKGAKAHSDLVNIDTGVIIGGAEAYCLRDEANWKDKPWFQLASMAQTRAGAKAFRNRLAWVAVMAGYKPTPAEEMTDALPVDKTQHYCKEHNTTFFMKGKMKAYAHPIGDTGEWCHEHKEEAVVEAQVTKTTEPAVKTESTADLSILEFKNPGEFYTACLKHFKLSKTQTDKEISMFDLSNPKQRAEAWQNITAIYGKK